jgi:hypothetical protein
VRDALDAERLVAAGSVDLLTMQFIFAYVDPEPVLRQARSLLKPGGLLSVVTSTFETLPTISRLGEMFVSVDEQHRRAQLPATGGAFLAQLAALGFEVVAAQPLAHELSFPDFETLYAFAVPGGWLVQYAPVFDRLRVEQAQYTGCFQMGDEFRGLATLARLRAA